MRVTVERSSLLQSLHRVHRVVERRNTIPILANMLLRAEGSKLRLKATDLDLEILDALDAAVDKPGATTVPAHLLHDIVRKLPEGSEVALDMADDGSSMAVTSGQSRFSLLCLPEAEFPSLETGDFSHAFDLAASALKKLIERTRFAISTEETRYYLGGIFMHAVAPENGTARLRAVATDGHRLARAEIEAPEGSHEMPGVIVPRKTVGELHKLVDDPDLGVRIEISEVKARFTVGGVVLTSKLIDGTFPDYQRVIPSNNERILTVGCASFTAAVDRVSTISAERGRAVKLSLADGALTFSVNSPDAGSATERIAANYDSEALDIGFNAKYLLDIAEQFTGEEAVFHFADASSPTLIRNVTEDSALFVLMPMRV